MAVVKYKLRPMFNQ